MAKRNTKLLTREEKLEHRENVIKLILAEQISVEEAMHQLKLSRSSVYRICDRYVQGGTNPQAISSTTNNGKEFLSCLRLNTPIFSRHWPSSISSVKKALRSPEKPYAASFGKYRPQRRLQRVV